MAKLVKGSKAAREFMAKIRAKKKGVGKTTRKKQTGTSNKAIDKKIQALPTGKRISKDSNKVYYERRANRSDKGKLLGIGNINLIDVGNELWKLEYKINQLKEDKKRARLLSDKKNIQSDITVYNNQHKALKLYLNTRAKFVNK